MKKLSFGIVLMTILVSCKKEYNCYCEYYSNGSVVTSGNTVFNETKREAKKKCKDLNSEGGFVMGGMAFNNETRCSLK